MQSRTARSTCWLLLVSALVTAEGGCTPTALPRPDADTELERDIELQLVVVDDAALAAAIGQLSGEWKARSGATLKIVEITSTELLDAESMRASTDAVIYPSWLFGTLAERGWIAPLPDDYAQNRELRWPDTFELLQVAETRWHQIPLAVPFGSPVLTCYYRTDLFEKFHRRPPRTWGEYHELAEFFGRRQNLGDAAPPDDATWHGCAEPLAEGWAGGVLLARAASYVRHRDHYSTLFNIDTMKPLISGAGYVRALEELVADAKLGPKDPQSLDPAAVREAFLQGHCALALAWPAHQRASAVEAGHGQPSVGFAELPGSVDVYNFADASWERRATGESPHVPLLGSSGRLGSVGHAGSHPQMAFKLLAWLSGKEWGGDIGSVSSASSATTLYRRSQMRQPQPWVDAGTDLEAAHQYAATVHDALSRPAHLSAVRIAGHERYMAALDEAVAKALGGTTSPSDALAAAAAEWTKITDELGRDAQRKAYRGSLGLEP